MPKKYKQEDFIEKAIRVHGNSYDYSNVEYVNSQTKVNIICPEHGPFLQSPSQHLYGNGCPKCAMLKTHKPASELKLDFLKKATAIHHNKYDYSKIEYVNSYKKIEIICPEHGSFFQKPIDHVQNHGCPKCAIEKSVLKRLKPSDVFIKESSILHNHKYNYSKTDYTGANKKVCITCPEHGDFWQRAADHLNGHGCPKCSTQSWPYTTDEWINLANDIHDNKYCYPNLEYKNNKEYIDIVCPIHGPFKQKAINHIQGQGCPMCSGLESPQELKIRKALKERGIVFDSNIVIRPSYPWHVDIFIKEKLLFLEYNGFWTHENHWYDSKSYSDRTLRKKYKKDNPDWCPMAWWSSDVKKRKTAKKNKLNYVVLWDEKDIDKWFELGCPDGHDYDFEYSWIKNVEERKEWLKTKKWYEK